MLPAGRSTLPPDFAKVSPADVGRRTIPSTGEMIPVIVVLINMPFGGGTLINRLSRQSLPSFAESIGCRTGSQLLLKFVLGHPAVTSIIPGTGSATHMAENMAAAHGQFARARDLILGWWISA